MAPPFINAMMGAATPVPPLLRLGVIVLGAPPPPSVGLYGSVNGTRDLAHTTALLMNSCRCDEHTTNDWTCAGLSHTSPFQDDDTRHDVSH